MNLSARASESTHPVTFRHEITPDDVAAVRGVVQRAGVFSASEIDIAAELVEERLARGPSSGYYFVLAEQDDTVLGYTCYGPIPATTGSYDLYWIVVDPTCQHSGIGSRLLDETERLIQAEGGRKVYAETSSRDQYRNARAFYERSGFVCEATLVDFYCEGDSKVVYTKDSPVQ